jgi:hypothetical protein
MEKSNFFGKTGFFLFRLLPPGWRAGLLKWIITVRYRSPSLVCPWNCASMKKILVLLPEDPVEAFHQINNYLRIAPLFKNAKVSIFCTKNVGRFFRLVHPDAEFNEYEISSRFLFSREFTAWGKIFSKEEFDLCLLLERSPDISLLFLVGKTVAPIRAGYSGAGDFPFLNIHVTPSGKRQYLADQNSIMAQIFGASERAKMHWRVSKETVDEITLMMRESNVDEATRLIGIDAGLFYTAFGFEWTRQLCNMLKAGKNRTCCLFIDGEPDSGLSEFVSSMRLPVFSNLSPSRYAALVVRCACFISGRSVFFELTNLIGKPLIGVFEKAVCSIYCKQSVSTRGITYSLTPDESTIRNIADLVDSLEKKVNN